MTDLKHECSTTVETPTKPGLHILVVEHQRIHQVLLQEQLQRLGCITTLAQHGREALQLWDDNSHDLLIISVDLPNGDAYQLTQHLRQQGINVPIIGIINRLEEQQRCLQVGMNAVLARPLCDDTLHEQLQKQVSAPIPKRYRAIFQTTMSEDLALFEQALQDERYESAQLVLHRMAGALVVMGMQDMADTMHEFNEKLSHNTDGPTTVQTHATVLCAALRDVMHHT